MNDLLLNGLKSKNEDIRTNLFSVALALLFLTMKMFRAAVNLCSAFITNFEHEFCCCEVVSIF